MDTMDYKSKMGSAILIAAAGAIFGAVVAMFVTRRQRKRKSDDSSGGNDDSLQTLRGELDECRKSLDDLRLGLEQETERRNESEAWNRKLEQDLVDLAAGRKAAEEKCFRLCRDLDRVKTKLKEAETEGRTLKIQIRDLTKSTHPNTDDMPSATDNLTYPQKCEQKPKILPKSARLNAAAETDGTMTSIPANFCFTDARVSYVMDDKISDSIEERFLENRLNNRPIGHSDSYEDDFVIDDLDDDYSDDDLEGLDDSDIAIIDRSVSITSDDNFELGKDVMGALIANAFKDGVIESREGDDVSLSGDVSADHVITTSPGTKPCPEQGEVSQESIGDIKTTRRFWEQMIAADQLNDDDDVLSDEDDDVTDEDDITDEEEDQELTQTHTDPRQQGIKYSKPEEHSHNGELDSSENLRNSENKLSPQDALSLPREVIPNGNGVTVNGGHHGNT